MLWPGRGHKIGSPERIMKKAVLLKEWSEYLLQWAGQRDGALARSPRRCEIAIHGELGISSGSPEFVVGRSRDEYGTVLHLTPSQDHSIFGAGGTDVKA